MRLSTGQVVCVCVTSYFEGHSATLAQEAVCVTTPAKLHAQFCFWVIAQVFRKHGQRGKTGCEGARLGRGRGWAVGCGPWGLHERVCLALAW